MITIVLLFPMYLSASSKDDALSYINQLRQEVGLATLSKNTLLEVASQKHADYLNEQHTSGHYETNHTNSFYSGYAPSDRVKAAGYYSFYTSENLSLGQKDIHASVDGLMSAIYHRYGFLDFSIDEIGIGINTNDLTKKVYNYDMGNSFANDICNHPSTYPPLAGETSYYRGADICPNISDTSLRISVNAYNDASYHYSQTYQDYIVWPPNNSTNITPVFYEESPDPLPDYSVSGYPVSIQFNDYRYKDDNITIRSFKLYDINGTEITDTRELNEVNDPNNHIRGAEFALFPLKRLQFNSKYRVVVAYSINGIPATNPIEWSFTTKSIGYPYYNITDATTTLTLQAGVTYAFYYPPSDERDVITSEHLSYSATTTDAVAPSVVFADQNTLLVTLSSAISSVTLSTTSRNASDNKTITLHIGSTDTANRETTPSIDGEVVPTSTALTASDIDALSSGWNLVGTQYTITDLSIFDNAKIIWIYNPTDLWGAYTSDTTLKAQIISNDSIQLIDAIPAHSGIWVFK